MISVIAWLWAFSFLLWMISWWLAYRQKKLLFWLFWNTGVGFVCWMLALSGALGGGWILLMWYCSLLAIPFWWLMKWDADLARRSS